MIERRPPPMWKQLARPPSVLERHASAWRLGGLFVVSAVDKMKSPVDGTDVDTWHVSVSRKGGHPSDIDVAMVRRVFEMADAEEDNHEPGGARHLFLAVDPAHRADCECNVTEQTFVEANGHRWKARPEDAPLRRAAMEQAWRGLR